MNVKKIGIFILLSFGISWGSYAIKTIIHIEDRSIIPMIFGLAYVSGPAIATFITQRIIYKEGFRQYGWSLDLKNYKWFLYTPLLFIALVLMIFTFIGIFGNTHIFPQFGQLDFSRQHFKYEFFSIRMIFLDIMRPATVSPLFFFILAIGITIVAGVTVYVPFIFGEEFGWRGLMLKETQNLGFFASNIIIGITWGLWHLPLILHGVNYPSHPYFGIVMMCIMTMSLAPIVAYVRLKTKSLLGACMLHGMIDASKPIFAFYIINANELYSSPVGWAGMMAFILMILFIYVFDRKFVNNYTKI